MTIVSALSSIIRKAIGQAPRTAFRGEDWSREHGLASREGSLDGFGVGDEELEEGIIVRGVGREGNGEPGAQTHSERRLSRELEGGFIDDSSDEEDRRSAGRGQLR